MKLTYSHSLLQLLEFSFEFRWGLKEQVNEWKADWVFLMGVGVEIPLIALVYEKSLGCCSHVKICFFRGFYMQVVEISLQFPMKGGRVESTRVDDSPQVAFFFFGEVQETWGERVVKKLFKFDAGILFFFLLDIFRRKVAGVDDEPLRGIGKDLFDFLLVVPTGVFVVGIKHNLQSDVSFENLWNLIALGQSLWMLLQMEVVMDVERRVLLDVESEVGSMRLVVELEGVVADQLVVDLNLDYVWLLAGHVYIFNCGHRWE